MQLHTIDITIIIAYLVGIVIVGFLLSKRAGKNLDSYFLSGKSVPWYLLGISCASSSFDITGTMWFVYIIFIYGLKGAWIPWIWPTFIVIFHMVYLAKWIRRSNVLTGAEWIATRFGSGLGGKLSQLSVVFFAIVSVIGFLSYGFQGIGKFAATFLPWDLSPNTYAVILMSLTTTYVILGGMYSVVLTDIVQFLFLTVSSVLIAVVAMSRISPAQIAAATPQGWQNFFFGWHLNLDWSNIIPAVNDNIARDGYSLFFIFVMMILFKGILISMAGVAPNFDMQRILATRTPKEASLMDFSISIYLFPRWFMISGIAILGLVFFGPQLNAMGPDIDFEMVLPYVINNFIPTGLLGLLLAGLLAAFMSTFDSTVNAGAAYITNDIYKTYINPNASDKQYVRVGYVASILIVVVGIIFGFMAKSIGSVTMWIVAGLYGGYAAPNILKWYWWRLNGYGYFWGMIIGIITAMILPVLFPQLSALNSFPIILVVSALACVLASLLSKPQEESVLKAFYTNVRPWGFWKPIHQKVVQENPNFKKNTDFKRDMVNIAVGLIWQVTLVVIPIYIVIKNFKAAGISALVLIITSLFLKKNWYNKLEED